MYEPKTCTPRSSIADLLIIVPVQSDDDENHPDMLETEIRRKINHSKVLLLLAEKSSIAEKYKDSLKILGKGSLDSNR